MDELASTPELLEALDDAAYCVDKTRRILAWNSAAEQLTGFSAAEAVGSRCWHNLLRHVDDDGRQLCRGWCPLVAAMQDGASREARVYLHHREGHRVPVHISARPLRSADGMIIGGIETFRLAAEPAVSCPDDHAGLARSGERLTGMVASGVAQICLEGWIEVMRGDGQPFGAVHLRIDARERVGVDFDLATCEAIIKAVSATISHAIRPGDAAARLADQEFLILLPESSTEELARQAERLRFLVEQTFLVKNRRLVRVHAQIGAALAAPGDSAEALLTRASVAVEVDG